MASYEITPVHRLDAADGEEEDRDRLAPATSTTISGLTSGTAYTFTVRATNPSGARHGVCAVELGHAARLGRAGHTDRALGPGRLEGGDPQLDRAGRRRQPDHELHHHPVRRLAAQTPVVVDGRRPARGSRADERDGLHVHGRGDQRGRNRLRAPPPRRRDAEGLDLRVRDARDRRRRRHELRRPGREVHVERRRIGDRCALLQGRHEHWHARRGPLERRRNAPGAGPFTNEPPPAGRPSRSTCRSASRPTRRTS